MMFNQNAVVDISLTKVFVGGLAWETPKEAIRKHFEQYGEITEAVIISDKLTGRSKGYGFVTFKDAEAAKKACEDAAPIINGRRANCNLASLGVRRPKALPYNLPAAPPQKGNIIIPRPNSAAHANHVQWYYPTAARAPASPFHNHHHHQPVPFYGYTPTYMPFNHNQKLNHTAGLGGSYMNGHLSQVYPTGQPPLMGANTLVPMYPMYPNIFHQTHAMGGLPTHQHQHQHQHQHHQHAMYSPSFSRSLPALIS